MNGLSEPNHHRHISNLLATFLLFEILTDEMGLGLIADGGREVAAAGSSGDVQAGASTRFSGSEPMETASAKNRLRATPLRTQLTESPSRLSRTQGALQ